MLQQSQFSNMTRTPWAFFAAAIFLACFLLSFIIPPMQSPDEFDHLKRIYLLSEGQIILDTPAGKSSGGMIDSGLASYLKSYRHLPFHPDRKLSAEEIDESRGIRWTGIKEFSSAPGTGYYFPLIYAPQAVGLAIGEALGLTVDTSYRMARFSVLVTSVLLLLFAFSIYRPPFLAAALLILPMSLFQFASASLDGISTALFVLAISCYSRIAIDKKSSRTYLTYLLIACVVLITSSRVHALPIFLLVFASYFYTRNKKALITGIAALLLVMAWLAIAIKFTLDLRSKDATPTASIIIYYLKDPIALVNVIYRTLNNSQLLEMYSQSFVGILGWLDAKFSNSVYYAIYCFCFMGILVSIPFKKAKENYIFRATLLFCAAGSVGLIFIALLITWTAIEHPAVTIIGVQGRYFLIPALLVAYALGSEGDIQNTSVKYLGFAIISIFFLFSAYSTSNLLIHRYFLMSEQQQIAAPTLTPSEPLSDKQTSKLFFDKALESAPAPLRSISIMFGTYMRSNQGLAELRMQGADGAESSIKIDLPSLVDNQYKTIDLDGKAYSSGELRALSGGGVSIWQTTANDGVVASCMIYEFTNGARRFTKGCPRS